MSDNTPKKQIRIDDGNDYDEAGLNELAETVNETLKSNSPELEGTDIKAFDDESVPEENLVISDELAAEIVAAEKEAEGESVMESNLPENNEASAEDEPTEVAGEMSGTETFAEEPVEETPAEEKIDSAAENDKQAADLAIAEDTQAEPAAGFKARWKRFWSSSRNRWIVFGITSVALIAISLVPDSRYFLLNNFGVRSTLSLQVVDAGTKQPLKNVTVKAGGSSGLTDSEGQIKLEKVKLGSTKLQIEKRAFANIERDLVVGWGSNPLGSFEADAVGAQYTFMITDFLSGKPIEGAELSSGDGNASSDAEGKAVLTLDTAALEDTAELSIDVTAESYRPENMKITVSNKEAQALGMVPARKHVYVSKRSGTYDVYAAHIDGKNEEKLVTGSGLERDDLVLVPHQKDDVAVFVSTRENVRNSFGYLLSTLYILDTNDGELVRIDQSERIQIIGWSEGGNLVYVKVAAGASGTDPKRHRLMSFNHNNFADVKELASSNAFNDVLVADGRVYYAPSNVFQENPETALYSVKPDGSDKQTILDREVYGIIRSRYDTLELSTGQQWYRYYIGSGTSAVEGSAPSDQNSRLYIDSFDGKTSLWRDMRDGQGVLLSYDKEKEVDAVLLSRGGLNHPITWLNGKYLVFRVNDARETADYVMNLEGGDPRKIADVTDTEGIGRWFYY